MEYIIYWGIQFQTVIWMLLWKIYQGFESLYGTNNTGLNVHNIGVHLVDFAKIHGPLWAWLCFPLKDLNWLLLRSAHGTGNLCVQLLSMLHWLKNLKEDAANMEDADLRTFTEDMLTSGKRVKTLGKKRTCMIAGKPTPVINPTADITALCGDQHEEVKRIKVHGQMFYSESYTRMEKRNCTVVLFDNEIDRCVGIVKKF